MALIILLIGCMVVGAASATDDIAVSDINAPDDSMQLNAYGEYNINVTTPTNITEDDNALVSAHVTNNWGTHSTSNGAIKFQLDNQTPTDYKSDYRGSAIADVNFGPLSEGDHSVKVTYAKWVNGYYEGFGPWKHWVDGYWNDITTKEVSFYVAPVVPVETNVTINNVRDLKVNEKNMFIYASEASDIKGTYVYLLNDVPCESPVIMGLPAGEYKIDVVFIPDDLKHYLISGANATFKVTKYDMGLSIVDVDPVESTYVVGGNDVTVVAKLVPGHYFPINQTVLFSLDGDNWVEASVYYVDGAPYVNNTFENLGAGNYQVFVKYTEDNYFNEATDNASFTINKRDTALDLTVGPDKKGAQTLVIVEGEGATVVVQVGYYDEDGVFVLAEDAQGTALVLLSNGQYEEIEIVNGVGYATFEGLEAGDYEVKVIYSGDDNYNGSTSNTTFTVDPVETPEPQPEPQPEPKVPTMANTGNPLLVLLIALAGLGIGSLRRKL